MLYFRAGRFNNINFDGNFWIQLFILEESQRMYHVTKHHNENIFFRMFQMMPCHVLSLETMNVKITTGVLESIFLLLLQN